MKYVPMMLGTSWPLEGPLRAINFIGQGLLDLFNGLTSKFGKGQVLLDAYFSMALNVRFDIIL